jgi:hypothetical protein
MVMYKRLAIGLLLIGFLLPGCGSDRSHKSRTTTIPDGGSSPSDAQVDADYGDAEAGAANGSERETGGSSTKTKATGGSGGTGPKGGQGGSSNSGGASGAGTSGSKGGAGGSKTTTTAGDAGSKTQDNNPCCVAHKGVAGCADKTVQECVCTGNGNANQAVSSCCTSDANSGGWDDICVLVASALGCTVCKGDCCKSSSSPGCLDNIKVEKCVCSADPTCCQADGGGWDAVCIGIAKDKCSANCS